jgi:hypothetical protein
MESNRLDAVPPPEIDTATRDLVADEGDTEHEPVVETISLDAVGPDDDDSTDNSDAVQTAPKDKPDSVEGDGMCLSKHPRLALNQKDFEDSAEAEDGAQSNTIDPERFSTPLHAPIMQVIRESVPLTLRVRPDQIRAKGEVELGVAVDGRFDRSPSKCRLGRSKESNFAACRRIAHSACRRSNDTRDMVR